ncbi:porin [Grimontia marina]|uniref:Long-chain fatty acid transport protein n=1 Tax=Grimontia marina TaxID=646534 RepID=A0A128ESX4_9GAMM|nr:porin [Grimontia marina]CZF77244.1 Long-chain fatty acid transport protein precursor [Grimontia marina]
MNKKRLFIRSAVAMAVAASSTSALAAGFQLNGQSATGLGRAFAGDAVIADNASVMARNPAAMAMFDSPELSLGVVAIDTDVVVKDAKYGLAAAPESTYTSLADEQIGDTSYVPNLFYIHPINEKFSVGLGIYSNFGTKTEFGNDYAANEFGGLTDLKTVNFGLSGSYRINDQFSIGAGVDYITGSGKLKRSGLLWGDNLLDVDAEGEGFGWNAGVVYELNQDNRFGLSYRNSPDIKADGEMMFMPGFANIGGELIMRLPDIAEFSGFHQLNKQVAVHYSVQWIEWNTFDKLATTNGTELNEYNWQDGWHYSIGGTYTVNQDWTLRAGYMYDTSAQDKDKSISVPDSDRQWLSAGLTYNWSKSANIDLGVTYLMGEDIKVEETNGITSVNATTRANAWLYGIQYSYKF